MAWYASACAWFPADIAITPRARSSGVSESSLFRAPRSLNDAVNWKFSNFTHTSAPVMSDSVRDRAVGVRSTDPAMRAAAASTSAAVTANVDVDRGIAPDGMPAASARRVVDGTVEDEADLGSAVGSVGGPHPTVVTVDDLLDDREPEAGARARSVRSSSGRSGRTHAAGPRERCPGRDLAPPPMSWSPTTSITVPRGAVLHRVVDEVRDRPLELLRVTDDRRRVRVDVAGDVTSGAATGAAADVVGQVGEHEPVPPARPSRSRSRGRPARRRGPTARPPRR